MDGGGGSRLWTQVLRNCRSGSKSGLRPKQPTTLFSQKSQSLSAAIEQLGKEQQASPSVYASLLRQCIANRAVGEGKRVHAHIAQACSGKISFFLGNLLLQLYVRCGHLEEARFVFDGLQQRNVFSWTSMMGGYVQHGYFKEALELFHELDGSAVVPDAYVFTVALAACSGLGDLGEGRAIHARCISQGIARSDIILETSFLNMYAKCGNVEDARNVFDSMKIKDSVSWNAMINAYAQNGYTKAAMNLYLEMAAQGMEPSDATFLSVLSVCSNFNVTRAIHERFLATGIQSSDVVTSLVTAYARCNSLENARLAFEKWERKTLFLWTALVAAYAHHGRNSEALELFDEMCSEGVQPDSYTYSIALMVCANMEALEEGMAVHGRIIASKIQQDNTVVGALINMYAKCGSLDDARKVFDRAAGRKGIVVWNAMISGYVQHEQAQVALELYQAMMSSPEASSVQPTAFTFSILLGACACLEALEEGRQIHSEVIAKELDSDTVVLNSLVKMYAKCGSLDEAMQVFEKAVPHSDGITWNAIMVAFARFGRGQRTVELYHRMQLQGEDPNQVTLTAVLTACGHTGLLNQFQSYFVSLVGDFAVDPALEHYECIADLLSRSGRLIDAEEVLRCMPFHPAAAPWRSLLGACRVHNNEEVAERAAEELAELEPQDHTSYVMLSNVYAINNE